MAVAPIPAGYHSVTPYLVLRDAAAAMEFYKKAFGAVELLTGIAVGIAGALALAGPSVRPYIRVTVASAATVVAHPAALARVGSRDYPVFFTT